MGGWLEAPYLRSKRYSAKLASFIQSNPNFVDSWDIGISLGSRLSSTFQTLQTAL